MIFGDAFRAKLKFKEGTIFGGQVELSEGYETLNADLPLEIKGTLKNLNIDCPVFPKPTISISFL